MVQFTVFKGSKEGKVIKSTTTKDLQPGEVLIKVTHSGVCGTDEHYKHTDMGLGHEGVGIIEDTGASVNNLRKGDSVGWGYLQNSCGHCKHCLTGHETLCHERAMYAEANKDQGSFSSHAIFNANYVYLIPKNIAPEHAAPLMCGGATVFSALRSSNLKSTDRVGIIGVGGLGHLAIQFASKMGCEVVVFSGTDSKKEEAMRLGASEFVATKGVKELKVGKPIDHLIVTTSAQPDWEQYLPIIERGGTIYPLTVSMSDLTIPYLPIIMGELRIQGVCVASRQVHRDMLEFAAHHEIRPIIEQFPMTTEGITEALNKLDEGKMRYRGVLIAQ